MSDEVVLPIPNLNLPQCLFVLSNPNLKHLHDKARKELLEGIKADEMGPYYRNITSAISSSSSKSPSSPSVPSSSPSSSSHPPTTSSSKPHTSSTNTSKHHTTIALEKDDALLEELEKKNTEELKRLDERLEEAQKTEGETEISEALKARANYLTRIGDKDQALTSLTLAISKTPGLGSRIDLTLTLVRLGFFFSDYTLITTNLGLAEKLIDEGGDWDRRNRLKVYRALYLISIRDFKRSAPLFLDALSTFTATELLSFNEFVAMGVVAGVLTLGRVELKKRVMSAPEVNQVLPDLPVLGDLFKNLYESHYDKFFVALASLEQTLLLPSRLLSPHARYYVREMRILAYTQLLESYRSLTLGSLARAFGVGEEFIDSELSRHIASSRLHARIDKVHGIVETTRPSLKTSQYELVVKKGDVLLNEVQRLSKVLH